MSGPCTDCGGPDYQTLEARIAELEAAANTSICIFCGATMEKDLAVMLDHAKGCELRPENRLMLQIAELEAENTELRKQNEILSTTRRLEEEVREQAEAELDALRQGCTCANFNGYKQDCNLDLSPCHHHALCHFTPSRWQPRKGCEG